MGTEKGIPKNAKDLGRRVQAVWDMNAEWWDAYFREGNDFQRLLISPSVDQRLSVRPGETVLDVACGNGHYARRLAARGARVVAIDISRKFLVRARARTKAHRDRIEYRRVDAPRLRLLLELGRARFDAAVANMALMDMVKIQPLYRALAQILRPGG